MKNIIFILTFILISTPAFAQIPQPTPVSQTQTTELKQPGGWWKTGSHPKDYDFHLDPNVKRNGKASGTMRSEPTATKESHGSMMQTFKPDSFRGKRIRLSGYLKTENVLGWSGFWLRVDGSTDSLESFAFDNMTNRLLKGTIDWKKYEVVLDVSEKAELIAFGVNLSGSGQVWADDLQIEIVSSDIASTNPPITLEMEAMRKEDEEIFRKDPKKFAGYREVSLKSRKTSPSQPVNMNFEIAVSDSEKKYRKESREK